MTIAPPRQITLAALLRLFDRDRARSCLYRASGGSPNHHGLAKRSGEVADEPEHRVLIEPEASA